MNFDISHMILNIGHSAQNVTWTDIGSLITSIVLVLLTFVNIAIYHKFSKYDVLLKEEFERLLEFKKKYTNTQDSINWFLNFLLLKTHNYAFHVEDAPIIKYSDIVYHYNKICSLNNYYNDYQYIFRKYELEKDIELLTSLLDFVKFLPSQDIELQLISNIFQKEGDFEKFILPQIGQIGGIFMTSAYFILNPISFPSKWYEYLIIGKKLKNKMAQKKFDDQFKKLSKMNTDEDYEKIKNEVSSRLNSLSFKLEHICMFPMRRIPKSLYFRQKKFYPEIKINKEVAENDL